MLFCRAIPISLRGAPASATHSLTRPPKSGPTSLGLHCPPMSMSLVQSIPPWRDLSFCSPRSPGARPALSCFLETSPATPPDRLTLHLQIDFIRGNQDMQSAS